jgi:hypothetical protein
MSLSLDLLALLDGAFRIMSGLWPVFVIPIGFLLAVGILTLVKDEVMKSVRRH